MSTLIFIWCVIFGFVPIAYVLLKSLFKWCVVIALLPFVPFLVAYENWNKKPIIARLIVVLYGLIYLIIIIGCLLQAILC